VVTFWPISTKFLCYFWVYEAIVGYFWLLKIISPYAIIDYFRLYYHKLFVPIIGYSIGGYWCLYIILVVIGCFLY
jgi:hypothetical protein